MRTFISGRDPYTPDYIHMHNLVHSQLIIVYFQYIASGFLPFSARGRRFETSIAYHYFIILRFLAPFFIQNSNKTVCI